ncbi:DUF4065 domain-containing protein ['Crotalaria aegyptiaca' phytoplasma]|uniref:DUF4065 domain-containing protein n=1 Tax=Candidatus Phytoplasma crotalariae TaxID=2982627 RepID=A0ABT9D350_9MOLU|nr:type II toxin-antitoxin system antitoxin SocA domain-containing protein ['Crotalaria aegyptiaca' phytoplasma]MDO8059413.1 DUF4065 domain-containing protein ['Crotalaria aegyptiaca' phytoplasma]
MVNSENKINVFNVAQFFVNKDKKINKTKIQKLLYYAQGYYLAQYNKVLFPDAIEAWPYGPVIPSVYAETLKQEFQKQYYLDFSSQMTNFPISEEQKAILEQVFDDFGQLSDVQLIEKTHEESPWKETYDPHKLYSQCIIKPSLLYNFFKNNKKNKKN